jgi:N-acetylmuramoyl-L-alanine amidase
MQGDSPSGEDGADRVASVGQGDRVVREGECVCSVAEQVGHFWQTLWNLADNRALRDARKSPTLLVPGDRLTVPPLRRKELTVATGATHQFKRHGVPSFLRLRFTCGGRPRVGVPFTVRFGTSEKRGVTDANGALCVPVPPDAGVGTLILGEGDTARRYPVAVGALMPVEDLRGLQRRLANLGFFAGDADGTPGPATDDAVRAFQRKNGLDPDGRVTAALRAELVRQHGS